ncbi:MAG: hypothetical protein ACR2JC_07790, partial [Chloroflexota bacterium]
MTKNDAGYRWVVQLVARTRATGMRVNAAALRRGHDTWPLLVLSPWFLLFGTLVAFRAPRASVGAATYSLFGSAAFALALAPGADDDNTIMAAAEIVAVLAFAYAFARFFLTFPVPRMTRGRSQLLAAPPTATATLGLAVFLVPS